MQQTGTILVGIASKIKPHRNITSRQSQQFASTATAEVRHVSAGPENDTPEDNDEDGKTARQCADRNVVETDGTIYIGGRDPPGQSTTYIASGDHRNEFYRLATFGNFPCHCPVSPTDLASVGFYYTGLKDRVKCYSCGMAVENWIVGDDVCHPKWHKSDCALMHGGDHGNIPNYSSERRKLFKQIFKICPLPPPSAITNMPCSSQHLTALGVGINQSHPVVSVVGDISNAMGNIQLNSRSPRSPSAPVHQVFQLADIHSPEHERLIFELNLSKESDRRKSFAKWPCYPAPELPAQLAEEGFFYLGNLDRTQCFSCSGVLRNWSATDDTRTEHGRHFPHCPIVLNSETRNIPMSAEERRRMDDEEQHRIADLRSNPPQEPDDPTPAEQRHLAVHFPCHEPMNCHMESEEARLGTFDRPWQANRLRATARQIAKAGFFYLGQGDRTKCFYCNGGLQNWEENDEPWTEHAKWFPGCAFVLRKKGADFVRRLAQENPNLNRPAIRNPVSYDIPPVPAVEERQQFAEQPNQIKVADTRSNTDAAVELRRLQQEGLCKSCHQKKSDVLCLPCSHIALCAGCSTKQNCPICGVKIASKIRVYTA